MAVQFVREHTDGSSKSAGTTVAGATAAVVPAGNLLVAWTVADNTGASTPTVSSLSKPAGESASWVQLQATPSASASAGAAVTGDLYAIVTTVDWASGTTITATLSASVTAKVIAIAEFSGCTATKRTAGAWTTGTGTNSVSSTPTGTIQHGDLVLGAAGFENNAVPTSSWTLAAGVATAGGQAITNVGAGLFYVITTGAGSQPFSASGTSDATGTAGALVPAAEPPFIGWGYPI